MKTAEDTIRDMSCESVRSFAIGALEELSIQLGEPIAYLVKTICPESEGG